MWVVRSDQPETTSSDSTVIWLSSPHDDTHEQTSDEKMTMSETAASPDTERCEPFALLAILKLWQETPLSTQKGDGREVTASLQASSASVACADTAMSAWRPTLVRKQHQVQGLIPDIRAHSAPHSSRPLVTVRHSLHQESGPRIDLHRTCMQRRRDALICARLALKVSRYRGRTSRSCEAQGDKVSF